MGFSVGRARVLATKFIPSARKTILRQISVQDLGPLCIKDNTCHAEYLSPFSLHRLLLATPLIPI